MTAEGHQVTSLHGGLETAERDAVMAGFRDGRTKVLITTNVIARGIDVAQVNLVINYDLPLDGRGKPDLDTYLHRIGECISSHSCGFAAEAELQVERVDSVDKEFQSTLFTIASRSRTWRRSGFRWGTRW